VARAADRDRAVVLADELLDLLDRRRLDDALDRDRIELRDVVDGRAGIRRRGADD